MSYRSIAGVLTLLLSIPAFAAADTIPAATADINPVTDVAQWGTLLIENDAFGVADKSDNDYSNGIAYDWGYDGYHRFEDVDMPSFLQALFGWTYVNRAANGTYALDYAVSQGMYTPDNLSAYELIEDDRPYAGTLTWRGRLRNYADDVSRSFSLTLGVVGPLSGAEQAQKVIHKLLDVEMPNGWDNQLKNEPVFRLDGEYLNRFLGADLDDRVGVDTILYTQAGLGNLESNMGAGLVVRLGSDLDTTYAFASPLATRTGGLIRVATSGFSWQVQAALYGQYVFNDITIDGNTFKDSHSVDLIHDQYISSIGFSLRQGNWGFDFSTQRGSRQYEQQALKTNFGSAGFTCYF